MTASVIRRSAKVVADGRLVLDAADEACSGCSGCGRKLLAAPRPFSLRNERLRLPAPAPRREVIVEVVASELLMGALVGYGLPAVLLAVGAFVGGLFDVAATDFWSVCGGLVGLAVGSLLLRLYDSASGAQLAVVSYK